MATPPYPQSQLVGYILVAVEFQHMIRPFSVFNMATVSDLLFLTYKFFPRALLHRHLAIQRCKSTFRSDIQFSGGRVNMSQKSVTQPWRLKHCSVFADPWDHKNVSAFNPQSRLVILSRDKSQTWSALYSRIKFPCLQQRSGSLLNRQSSRKLTRSMRTVSFSI